MIKSYSKYLKIIKIKLDSKISKIKKLEQTLNSKNKLKIKYTQDLESEYNKSINNGYLIYELQSYKDLIDKNLNLVSNEITEIEEQIAKNKIELMELFSEQKKIEKILKINEEKILALERKNELTYLSELTLQNFHKKNNLN